MIKDNHITVCGGVTEAVQKARTGAHHLLKIEVETTNLNQVQAALDAGADIIMLDNMDLETMAQALEMINGRALVEVSGNVARHKLAELAQDRRGYHLHGRLDPFGGGCGFEHENRDGVVKSSSTALLWLFRPSAYYWYRFSPENPQRLAPQGHCLRGVYEPFSLAIRHAFYEFKNSGSKSFKIKP